MSNNEWQPIETAPTDGTGVLLAYTLAEDDPMFFVSWGVCEDNGTWWAAQDFIVVPARSSCPAIFDYQHPTYWMPLPEPPNELDIDEH